MGKITIHTQKLIHKIQVGTYTVNRLFNLLSRTYISPMEIRVLANASCIPQARFRRECLLALQRFVEQFYVAGSFHSSRPHSHFRAAFPSYANLEISVFHIPLYHL